MKSYASNPNGKICSSQNQSPTHIDIYYDAQNKPAVAIYNGVAYGYLYNLQGDVVTLVDGTGAKIVEYRYDAWEKPISKTGTLASTLGTLQPFRYRGYVFDEETGDYYLRSRYYRAEWGRFVSADKDPYARFANNLYRYCDNDSINNSDISGQNYTRLEPDFFTVSFISAVEDSQGIGLGFRVAPKNRDSDSYESKHNVIYRWYIYENGKLNKKKLVPREVDLINRNTSSPALSFSVNPRPGSGMFMADSLRETGMFEITYDKKKKVSILATSQ